MLEIAGAAAQASYASNRLMSRDYNGPLLRVRRASDDDETDLLGNPQTGWASLNQLASFATGTSVFASKAYDLTGGGRHLEQPTKALQPKVWDSVTGPILNGRNLCMKFDGVDDYLVYATDSIGLAGDFSYSIAMLVKHTGGGTLGYLASFGTSGSGFGAVYYGSATAGSIGGVGLGGHWGVRYRNDAVNEQLYTPNPAVTTFSSSVITHQSGAAKSAIAWRQNGNVLTQDLSDAVAPAHTAGSLVLGAAFNFTVPAPFEMANFTVFPSVLSGASLAGLEAQLGYMRTA